jgi:hypothetical protein
MCLSLPGLFRTSGLSFMCCPRKVYTAVLVPTVRLPCFCNSFISRPIDCSASVGKKVDYSKAAGTVPQNDQAIISLTKKNVIPEFGAKSRDSNVETATTEQNLFSHFFLQKQNKTIHLLKSIFLFFNMSGVRKKAKAKNNKRSKG